MGQIKHKMGNVGGGVDISHKSKMSGKAKSLMSFPGGMPGPGDYGNMDPRPGKIVGKGMAKYLAGESVGMRKMDAMHNGQPGVQQEDFEQFVAPDSTGPSKRTKSERQSDRDDKRTKRRAERADKRIKRGEKRTAKLQKKIDADKDPKGYRASRLKARQSKIDENKKISQKGKELKKSKGEEKAKIVSKTVDGKKIMGAIEAAMLKKKRDKINKAGEGQFGQPALIGKKIVKPKAKGKTTPNTNRKAKTFFDKGKDFLSGVVNHAVQGVKDDAKTIVKGAKALGSAFDRNAKKGK